MESRKNSKHLKALQKHIYNAIHFGFMGERSLLSFQTTVWTCTMTYVTAYFETKRLFFRYTKTLPKVPWDTFIKSDIVNRVNPQYRIECALESFQKLWVSFKLHWKIRLFQWNTKEVQSFWKLSRDTNLIRCLFGPTQQVWSKTFVCCFIHSIHLQKGPNFITSLLRPDDPYVSLTIFIPNFQLHF